MDDESKQGTRQKDGDPARQAQDDESSEQQLTRPYQPKERVDDEATAMLSRQEILAQAARDRDELRERQSTMKLKEPQPPQTESPEPSPASHEAKTRKMPAINAETTVEVAQITGLDGVAQEDRTVDTTLEFAEHGIATVANQGSEVQFPVRVDDDLRLAVPAEVAAELDLSPGELVMVDIKKVGD